MLNIKVRRKSDGKILTEDDYEYFNLYISIGSPYSIISFSQDDNEDGDLEDYISDKSDEYEVISQEEYESSELARLIEKDKEIKI